MEKMFLRIYDYLRVHKALRRGILACLVAFLAFASSLMSLKEDIGDFLPADKKNADVSWAFTHLNSANRAVITINCAEGVEQDNDLLMDAVDTLESLIGRMVPPECISKVSCRVDADQVEEVTGFIVDNLPYYLTDSDYSRIDSILDGGLHAQMEMDKAIVASPVAGPMRSIIPKDPLLASADRLKGLESFKVNNSFKTVDDYFFTSDGSALVTVDLAFDGSDTMKGGLLIESLDEAMNKCGEIFDGQVVLDALGGVFIAHTNASQIKKDTIFSMVIAITLIAALLIIFFRRGRSILFVGVTVAFGFLTAFGICALVSGSISMIVVGMCAIITGIAANYPLHFLAHIKQGYTPRESLSDIVQPLTTGNITTVAAFLSLLFLSSPAMRDLGLFAAMLLVGTIVFTLVFLPHIVPDNGGVRTGLPSWGGLSSAKLENKWVLVAAVAVITVFLSFYDDKVSFDSNLHGINYMTERQKAGMDKMLSLAQGGRNLTYVAVPGKTLDEALENYDAALPAIDSAVAVLPEGANARGLRDFVPGKALQKERLDKWKTFVSARRDKLVSDVEKEALRSGFREGVFDSFGEMLDNEYSLRDAGYFSPLTDNVAQGFIISDEDRFAILTLVVSDELCTDILSEKLSDTGEFIIFDSSTLTGEMVGTLSVDFDKVLYICAFLVFALLLISFGRLEPALIAFLPLTIGWIWILGIMALLGINFNIVNIILATFIFGMGDDYTIFITEGAMYEYAYGRKIMETYKSTIILSALIMFVGIGALIVAKHPAMLSLAYVIMIGMSTVVLMAILVPPFIFKWLTYKKGHKRTEPVTIVNLLATIVAFSGFLVIAVILSLGGFLLVAFTFGSSWGKLQFHRLLRFLLSVSFRIIPFTKTSVDTGGETFEKPAVIVANHQSHLDLMALLQLTPKMIVLTNKWAWNNPFYGLVIRFADFCPVENLMDKHIGKIRKMVSQGYSILVFPEGTRTKDGRIGQFQRGACLLAQELSLDIVPIILHGFYDVLPKQDFLLRKGEMNVKVLGRFDVTDDTLGGDFKEKTKGLRRYMLPEFEKLAAQHETADYFAEKVIHNYIYKGSSVERSVRRTMKENRNFRELVLSLPQNGKALFVEPNFGESSLLCAFVRKNLEIDAVIADEMTYCLARECAGVPGNLHYFQEIPDGQEYDVKVVFEQGKFEIEK